MKKDPFFSIITVNRDNLEGLKKTMQSIFYQTFQDFEFLIIDGGSKDGSKDYIEQYSKHIDHWVSETDKGIYNGMNKGLEKCKGSYVVFLNSGDCFLSSDTLESCKTIIRRQEADVFYGQINIDDNGTEKTIAYPSVLKLQFLQNRVINHQACFFKLNTLLGLGGYNEGYPLAADYHFYLKAYLSGKKFHPILFPVVKYDISGTSSVRMKDYETEMKKVWKDTVPSILLDLENKYSDLLATIKSSQILRLAFIVREYKIKIFHGK